METKPEFTVETNADAFTELQPETQPKEGPAKKKKKKKGWIVALIVLFSVLALLLTPVVAVLIYGNAKLNKIEYSDGVRSSEGIVEDSNKTVAALTAEMEAKKNTLPQKEIIEASGEIMSQEGVTNILLLITDETGEGFNEESYVETMVLISTNQNSDTMKFVTLDGGIGVKVLEGTYAGQYDRLANTYRYGGEALLMKQVTEAFRVEVNNYIRVNHETLIRAVDGMGGSTVSLTEQEAEKLKEACGFEGGAGTHELTGQEALAYAYGGEPGDFADIKEKKEEIVNGAVGNLIETPVDQWNGIVDTILPQVRTNMEKSGITDIILALPTILTNPSGTGEIQLPLDSTYGWNTGVANRMIYALDFETNSKELQKLIYGN